MQHNRTIVTRMVKRDSSEAVEFDRKFWADAGPGGRFAAAWDLVVGAHAVIFYTEPRYTKDLDIWINPTKANAVRVMNSLHEFGAPLGNVTIDDFIDPEKIFQIGVAPNRIDVLMGISGVDFATAFERKTITTYDDIPIAIIGKHELILSKKAIGRPQDLLDIERLES